MEPIDTNEWAGLNWLARQVNVSNSTLLDASTAGYIRLVEFPCGTHLYSIADAKAYAANRPRRGPKPKG